MGHFSKSDAVALRSKIAVGVVRLQAELAGKAAIGHEHGAQYESAGAVDALAAEVDAALASKSDAGHDHDAAYEPLGAVAALVDSAPAALNTLNELAAAFGDDANFAATVTAALAGKQPAGSYADAGHDHDGSYEVAGAVAAHAAAADPHIGYQKESEKGQANGYASLDGNARVPIAQIASGTPDGTKFVRDDGTLQTPAGGGGGSTSPKLAVVFHGDATANVTLTNQANAEQFLGNSDRNIKPVDLTDFTEYRLCARVVTASASPNSPRLYAQYHTSFTTTVATHSPLGASGDVALSLAAAGSVKTAWTAIVAGAKADVFVTVMQNGGNASADPALGNVEVQFR